MKRFVLHIVLLLFLLVPSISNAQAFADEIAAFKKADAVAYPFPGKHAIVFAGSSSFRKWEKIQDDFPGFPIINRGFGGSTLPDLHKYLNDVIIKYAPRQVIIYCGENDLAAADSITAQVVLKRFKDIYFEIRKALPAVAIAFVSIKPSPSRQNIQPKVIEANKLIRKFLENKDHTAYIDVYTAMLNADGSMRKELFVEDALHMNEQGYAIWKKIIEPYLIR